MANIPILKMMTWIEETFVEGLILDKPSRKAVVMAVIKNSMADRYKDDLGELAAIGHYLGGVLSAKAKDALGIEWAVVEGLGSGCIVGEDGEIEQGAAVLYSEYPNAGFGKSFRQQNIERHNDVMGNVKVGSMNESLDILIGYKSDAFLCSHRDSITVNFPGAPRRDEMVVVVVITDSPRPNARIKDLRNKHV